MDWFHTLVGQSSSTIEWWQMTIRAVLLFGFAVVLVRLGGNRIFGKHTVLDIVLGVVLGSNISRALTGNAPFVPSMIATAVLVAIHAGLAHLAIRSDAVGKAVKGTSRQLVDNGEFLDDELRKAGVTEEDFVEVMREAGDEPDLNRIRDAYLERSGAISIILADEE
jgi:uncharacterized membrane protein YcaP (DUF421 family)